MNYVEIIQRALAIASECLLKDKSREIAVFKGARDYSTKIDLEIESEISSYLANITPNIPIIGEEFTPSGAIYEMAWVVDPIDGTVNFSRNHPMYGVSIALVTPKTPIASGILIPELGKTYIAELGSGSHLNGQKISVSSTCDLASSLIGFGDFCVDVDSIDKNLLRTKTVFNLAQNCLRVRMHGTAALDMCFVADGTIDGSITLSNSVWDMQAGVLIVRESGGIVVDHKGDQHTVLSPTTICTTPQILSDLLPLVVS